MRTLVLSEVVFAAIIAATTMASTARDAAPEARAGLRPAGNSTMVPAAPTHHARGISENSSQRQMPPRAVAAIARIVHVVEQSAGKLRKVAENSDVGWTADYFDGNRCVKSVESTSDFVREYYFDDSKLIFAMITFGRGTKGQSTPYFEKYYYSDDKLIFWANNYNQTSKVSDRVAHEANLNTAYTKRR